MHLTGELPMTDDVIEVCIRRPLRRPEHKGGGIAVHLLLLLRDSLNVPGTATLVIHDRDGENVRVAPLTATPA
jgi:hypothetical protein